MPGLRYNAGAPSAGTNAVQTLAVTGSPTGGTYKLGYDGFTTAALAYNANDAAIQAALQALPSIGSGNATVSSGVVTFAGALARRKVPLITLQVNALTGGTTPTVTVANTTPGVHSTHRGAPTGAVLMTR